MASFESIAYDIHQMVRKEHGKVPYSLRFSNVPGNFIHVEVTVDGKRLEPCSGEVIEE